MMQLLIEFHMNNNEKKFLVTVKEHMMLSFDFKSLFSEKKKRTKKYLTIH